MTPREELDALRREQSGGNTQVPEMSAREELEALRRMQAGRKDQPFYSERSPLIGPAIKLAQDPATMEYARGLLKGGAASLADVGRTVTKPLQWMLPDDTPLVGKNAMGETRDITKQWRKEAGGAGVLGGIATDLAATGGVGGLVKKAGSYLPQAVSTVVQNWPKTSAAVKAAIEGGASGAYLSPDDTAKGAGVGAAGGAIGQQILSRIIPKVAAPINIEATPGVTDALQRGVPMTAGFGSNPNTPTGKAIRWIEESAAAVPFLGAGVKAQREAARRAARDVPLQEAAFDLLGTKPPIRGTGNARTFSEMVGDVSTDVGKRYDTLMSGKNFPLTARFQANLDNIAMNPKLSMVPADRARARSYTDANLIERQIPPGQLNVPGTTPLPNIFKGQSDIRSEAYKSLKSTDSSERAYARMLLDAADETYSAITRRFPRTGAQLEAMREPMHRLKTLQEASSKVPVSGEFTMPQLAKAATDSNQPKMLQWASTMDPLLSKDPGTISNAARAAFVLGAPHIAGVSGASIPLAVALHSGLGTRVGQKTLTGQLGWQKKLSKLLDDPAVMDAINRAGGLGGREVGIELNRR